MDPPWECDVTTASPLADATGGVHGLSTLSFFRQTPAPRSKGWTPSRCSGSWHKWPCTYRNPWCCRRVLSASPGP